MLCGAAGPANAPLHFSSAKEFAGVAMERKICEGFCGGMMFMRPVPQSAKHGDKMCPKCAQRAARWARLRNAG